MVGCGKKTVEPEQKPAVLSEENQKRQPAVLSQEEQKKQQKATAEIKKLGGMVRRGEPDVSLTKSGITDADLVYLKGLTNLRCLDSAVLKFGFREGFETMAKQYDVMAAGHLCLDIIPRFTDTGAKGITDVMRPGKLVNVEAATVSTGGPVSNTGINMKTLGSKVCFCACTGDDAFGKLTVEMLRQSGNAEGVHTINVTPSSYTVVVAPPGIDRIFLHNPGTNNTFCSDDLDPDLISQCRHFHFGYPPLMERMFADEGIDLQRVFRIAKEAGATTSCDMTLPDPDSTSGKAPWRNILRNILPYVDIFVPSIEETFYMLEPREFLEMKARYNDTELIDHFTVGDYSNIADAVLAMGCKMTTLKSGHRGFYVKTNSKETFDTLGAAKPRDEDNWSDRELWAPAFEVDEFGSATGSGDSSIAGFLSAFLRGSNIEDALKYATCCGLQNVRVLDAVSGIKTWEETTQMLEEKMPMIDTNIKSDGWNFSAEYKLWSGPNDLVGLK